MSEGYFPSPQIGTESSVNLVEATDEVENISRLEIPGAVAEALEELVGHDVSARARVVCGF